MKNSDIYNEYVNDVVKKEDVLKHWKKEYSNIIDFLSEKNELNNLLNNFNNESVIRCIVEKYNNELWDLNLDKNPFLNMDYYTKDYVTDNIVYNLISTADYLASIMRDNFIQELKYIENDDELDDE